MNASASYRNGEILKKTTSSKNLVPDAPSTSLASLKSEAVRPGAVKATEEQNGMKTKRKSNGHPPVKPGTSAEITKSPVKRRKVEVPPKATCPMDLIMDEMNNEWEKQKAKKKADSDDESQKGESTLTFRAPTYLDLLRIESDNSMVFEFLNKRVPSVCEMVLAYKMLRGRVDNFNLTYFDRTKIKNIEPHIPPDAELLQELRGPDVANFDRGNMGPRTPSGSPPSPTPPAEEKTTDQCSSGYILDDATQETRINEVKEYLAKRLKKDIKDVESMMSADHWKFMGSLQKELMFAMIDQMVESTIKQEGLSMNSPTGNSGRNSVAMDISSNSSSINEKPGRSRTSKPVNTPTQPSTSFVHTPQRMEIYQSSTTPSEPVRLGFATQSHDYSPVQHQALHPPSAQGTFAPSHSQSFKSNVTPSKPPIMNPLQRYATPSIQPLMPQYFNHNDETREMVSQGMPVNTTTPHPMLPLPKERGDFNKPNKRGGTKMNKSQKRFQEFKKKPLDPKFTNIDMNLIRNVPPPPIPKIILEQQQQNGSNLQGGSSPPPRAVNLSPPLAETIPHKPQLPMTPRPLRAVVPPPPILQSISTPRPSIPPPQPSAATPDSNCIMRTLFSALQPTGNPSTPPSRMSLPPAGGLPRPMPPRPPMRIHGPPLRPMMPPYPPRNLMGPRRPFRPPPMNLPLPPRFPPRYRPFR